MTRIVDLTVPIGEETLSPPSVDKNLELTTHTKGPGHWQSSEVDMLLHTGSHVDFERHTVKDGETAADVSLDRVCGDAFVVDLSETGPNDEITKAAVMERAADVRDGDIVLIRTDWTDKAWGEYPTYYDDSPYCAPEAAEWLVDNGAKAVGFDCFSEYPARLPEFDSADFQVHKVILENGAILMQHLTNLSELPADARVPFYGPFIKVEGGEGSPARFFAVLES
ncbi:cyclase family protein [Halostagnicola sp. A-GB9-2]|uniref:cyclase family protein n=1 Tax=Halostagnicola sp. A-GB9-2 TaxID=3048066 RepID=UPI0024C02E7E|nr:cyclase family protein [Halostagnicola sp. A-GB9-2]MDJ1434750.1 cyclase family protein [Halostagnicola sp. A-GB9-2]